MSVNVPNKMPVPFADAGLKNTIPATSDNVNGFAGYNQGFPPINMTAKTAGGIPPFGQDMNGILFAVTEAIRFFQAGSIFTYDSTFSTAVGGYRAGARVLRTDGSGYWLNLTDANTTDPESAGAAAAGWVPDFTYGIAPVVMTNANVTLTPSQYGKPIISISGALTGNLNLIFPNIAGEWIVVNSTTGSFAVTCKTASGTGVAAPQGGNLQIFCDTVNIISLVPQSQSASVVGSFSNLKASATGLNALTSVTADELIVENSSNSYQTLRAVSVSPSLSSSGVNGLDTGTSAASTWYSVWVISNGVTAAGLYSLSATSPTMPVGYTHKARVGWVRSDSTANKYPLSFIQYGTQVRYKVATGSNVTGIPTITSGTQGNAATPTYVSASVATFVPPTATSIMIGTLNAGGTGALVTIAPNNAYGSFNSATNPPPYVNNLPGGGSAQPSMPYNMGLESLAIFVTINAASIGINCMGWEDML